jgi:hypothetical protein
MDFDKQGSRNLWNYYFNNSTVKETILSYIHGGLAKDPRIS